MNDRFFGSYKNLSFTHFGISKLRLRKYGLHLDNYTAGTLKKNSRIFIEENHPDMPRTKKIKFKRPIGKNTARILNLIQ